MKTATQSRTVRYDPRTSTLTITQDGVETHYRTEAYTSEIGGRAFSLLKEDAEGDVIEGYDVLVGSEADSCDCKDATYRGRRCKHYLALAALITAGRI